MEELEFTLKQHNEHRAPGMDEISHDMIKHLPHLGKQILLYC